MKKIIFIFLGCCLWLQAHEKLDLETQQSINDIYDVEAHQQVKFIEKYFAFEHPEVYDDTVKLSSEEGQMEDGFMMVVTPGKPLKMTSKFGTYTFNNCSSVLMSEEDLKKHLQKEFGAQQKSFVFNADGKSILFDVHKIGTITLPKPKQRSACAYVRPEEARHAFDVLNQQYEDTQAQQELSAHVQDVTDSADLQEPEAFVKEWQSIAKKNYPADSYAQPLFSLHGLKAFLQKVYAWNSQK